MTPELVEALQPWGMVGSGIAVAWLALQFYRQWSKNWRVKQITKSGGDIEEV